LNRSKLLVGAVALLAVIGLWEVGHGVWIHAKARLAQFLLQRAWERTLRGEAAARPWPWADTWPVARLRVPAHGVDLIVLSGVSGRTLAFGPGHAPDSAPPGEPGTKIVTGHRDTHFRFLERVRRGDEIFVEAPGRPLGRFRVEELAVVDSRSAVIRSEPRAAALVLMTCFPFDAFVSGGPLRYVVTARAAEDRTSEGTPASSTIRSLLPDAQLVVDVESGLRFLRLIHLSVVELSGQRTRSVVRRSAVI
jgi:sortase A